MVKISDEELDEAVEIWNEHSTPHRNCYYETDWAGSDFCPGEYNNTFEEFLIYHYNLTSSDIINMLRDGRISLDKLAETNSRSRLVEPDFPVGNSGPDFLVKGSGYDIPVKNTEAAEAVLSDPHKEWGQGTDELREALTEALAPLTDAILRLVDLLEKRLRL